MTLGPDDLAYVRRIVAERSAIQLEEGKEYLIESRLETLARLENQADATVIVEQMRRSPSGPMTQKVVEAMTTNETSFFRDRLPFDALRDSVLPALVAARSATRRLNIWCGAASTGQEPYSIAMLIREHFPELAAWNVSILATDLSTEVLEKARSGRYSQLEVGRGLPAPMLVRHFEQDGARWKVRPAVREMVEFRELNLIGTWAAMPRPDIVFLRNVMIYFDVQNKQRILAKIAANIASDGYLFLGAGETTLNLDTTFRRIEIDRAGVFQVSRGAPDLRPVEAAAAIGTAAAAPRVDWPALGSTPTRPLPTAGVTGTIRPVPRGVT
ncbi:MAG: protein-glutamate O-methyltransferase CheR [Acidimicrobiales bacterium]